MKISHDVRNASYANRHSDSRMFADMIWPEVDGDDDVGIEFCQRLGHSGRRVSPALADI
jgi:hypothetical protein